MLLMLMFAACGGRAGYTAEQQTVDGITIKLEHPQQLALLQNYELFVTLTGADGKPIDGATVFMEQDMPAMPMNSNQPLGEPLGSGQYRITGVFSMEGDWRLVIHANVAGQEYAATFDQTVTPQP
jgi:YtkA-like